jgi:GNAT superfamily N-acetyltransferase
MMLPPDSVTFRSATADDAAHIVHHAHGWGRATAQDRENYRAWAASALQRGLYHARFACINETVIAGAGVLYFEGGPALGSASPMRARLVNVFTEPEHRRKGLSAALCAQVLDHVRACGVQLVALACTADSRSIYERLGFKAYPAEMRLLLQAA